MCNNFKDVYFKFYIECLIVYADVFLLSLKQFHHLNLTTEPAYQVRGVGVRTSAPEPVLH